MCGVIINLEDGKNPALQFLFSHHQLFFLSKFKKKKKESKELISSNTNMCNKNSPARRRRQAAEVVSPKLPARKTRTKTRKPKYLSIKLELSPKIKSKTPNPKTPKNKMTYKQQQEQQQQLIDLFPLHPENLVQQEKDIMHDQDHVAFLFETASDTSTTLHGLLDSTATTTTTTSEEGPLVGGLEIDHQSSFDGPSLLVRTAMRCKERDLSEERWVSYWEVVEKKDQEEVSSSSSSIGYTAAAAAAAVDVDALGKKLQEVQDDRKGLVGLKLDYQEIMNAWSDKGPLYNIEAESPQIVPDFFDGSNDQYHVLGITAKEGTSFLGQALMEGWGNLWRVPEMDSMKVKDKTLEEAKESWKSSGHREASMLRYKEKRRSRLFAKRIRYEVRKLNAEKRPRLKGRFVKRT